MLDGILTRVVRKMAPEFKEVAFITGAAGGIGRATVARLRARGVIVFATDLSLAAVPCGDADFHASSLDVTIEADIAKSVQECVRTLGRIDHVIHLAGKVGAGPLTSVALEDWNRLLAVNLTSAFLLARAAHEPLQASRGTFTLVASTHALNGGSAQTGPAYAVAKAGLVNLTRYLAKEWAPDGIRVNTVAPGPIDTPMLARLDAETRDQLAANIPLRRLGTASDVATAIAHLTHHDSRYLTGTVQNVSGGLVID